MKKSVITFIISAFIGLGLGYLVFEMSNPDQSNTPAVAVEEGDTQAPATETNESEASETNGETVAVSDDNIIQAKGCLSCHAVSKLGLQGGATGPDLSDAFANVADKHGKPLDEFLQEPTSAVMSTVISGSPLTDEEISGIVDMLKQASES